MTGDPMGGSDTALLVSFFYLRTSAAGQAHFAPLRDLGPIMVDEKRAPFEKGERLMALKLKWDPTGQFPLF
jgi:hypothetical protein